MSLAFSESDPQNMSMFGRNTMHGVVLKEAGNGGEEASIPKASSAP